MFVQSPTSNKRQYSVFKDLNSKATQTSEIVISPIQKLSPDECNSLYRNSPLSRKIVKLYPQEAFNLGYVIKDSNGEIIEQDNRIVLKSFLNASMYARIYGHCFVYYSFSDNSTRLKPLEPNPELVPTSYKLFYNMQKIGDFWEKNNVKYHKSKIMKFTGVDAFLPLDNYDYIIDETLKSDSIFDSLIQSLYDEFSGKTYGKHILENLSYLLVGMKGLASKVATTKGKSVVDDRMQTISDERDMSRVFSYDLENEEIEFINQSLTGVRDMIQEFKEAVSAASEYPYDKLFEKPPIQQMGGSGMQNQLVARFLWAEKVHDWARFEWLDNYIDFFDRLYGKDNYELEIPFKFNMTDLEKAELEDKASQRTERLINAGVIVDSEARTGYKDAKFTLNLALMSDEEFEKYKEEKVKQAEELAAKQAAPNEEQKSDKKDGNDNSNSRGTSSDTDNNTDSMQLESLSVKDWEELAIVNFNEMSEYVDEVISINNKSVE